MAPTQAAGKEEEGGGPEVTKLPTSLGALTQVPTLCFGWPQSCYGGAIALPILDPRDSFAEWLEVCFTQYFLVALNTIVQSLFLVEIYRMNLAATKASQTSCTELDTMTLVIGLWAFLCVILTDLQETADLCDILLRQLPTLACSDFLRYARGEEGIKLVSGGISARRKVALFAVTILPKTAFGVFLLWLGVQFLFLSNSDSDIILNCFALVFVLQVDELIFLFLCPAKARRLLEIVPPILIHGERKDMPRPWNWWQLVSMPGKLLLSILLSFAAMNLISRCGNEYEWDAEGFQPED